MKQYAILINIETNRQFTIIINPNWIKNDIVIWENNLINYRLIAILKTK